MKFGELKIGMKDRVSKTFTDADVKMFAGVSSDVNPIHMSDEAAKNSIFGRRVVHGILVLGAVSAVLANKLPGEGTVYLGQECRFVAPVFIGNDVTAEAEVIELCEDNQIVKLATNCYNQEGKLVLTGVATVKVPL